MLNSLDDSPAWKVRLACRISFTRVFLPIYALSTSIWEAAVLWLTLRPKHNVAEYQSLLFSIQHRPIAICWDHASLVIFVVVILYASCDCLVLPPDILLGASPCCASSTSHSSHSIVANFSWSFECPSSSKCFTSISQSYSPSIRGYCPYGIPAEISFGKSE